MLRAIKKRLAIRSYRNKLGPWLERQYGWRANYTPVQVRTGADTLGLPTDPLCFAYAMYCSRSDFDAHHAAAGESCNYDVMRAEVSNFESAASADSSDGGSGGSWSDAGGNSGDSGGGDCGGVDGGGGGD